MSYQTPRRVTATFMARDSSFHPGEVGQNCSITDPATGEQVPAVVVAVERREEPDFLDRLGTMWMRGWVEWTVTAEATSP